MNPFLWTMAGIMVVAVIVLFALSFLPAYRAYNVRQAARTVGLALPAGSQPVFEARFAARLRATTIGALVGTTLVITALLTGVIPSSAPRGVGNVAELWLIVGGFYVGMGVGSAVRALTARVVVPSGERFARPGAVGVTDYLAPIDLIGARLAVAAGVLVLILASMFSFVANGPSASNPLFGIGSLVVLLGVASLAVFEISARRILNRAQPVASPEDLAWDDAIRAMTVREIVSAPMSLGVWGSLAIAINLGNSVNNGALPIAGLLVVNILVILIALGILAAAVYSTVSKPQQHYLRRLWPDVAAQGQALQDTTDGITAHAAAPKASR